MVKQNDPGWPLAALIVSAVLGWGAYACGHRVVGPAAGTAVALSEVQIGLISFSVLLMVYGIIGLVSVWLEGRVLYPRKETANPGRVALAAGLLGVLVLVSGAGVFAGFIAHDQRVGATHPTRDALIAGGIFLLGAVLAVCYRRFFMDDEIRADDERAEVPW